MIDFDFKGSDDVNVCFSKFYEMIRHLRANCPWDSVQTPATMSRSIQGELYEYIDSIAEGDKDHQKEELGDLFMNLFLMLAIHDDSGDFSDSSVLSEACAKYIRRHPHVFGSEKAETVDQVLSNWQTIKRDVEGRKSDASDFFNDIPNSSPELERCYKISKKAAGVGFEWPDIEGVYGKVCEELGEVRAATTDDEIEDELGDVLFTVVNLCRHYHVKPQNALDRANHKFTKRFNILYKLALEQGLDLENLSADQWDDLWKQAKVLAKTN